MNAEEMKGKYRELFGRVPENINRRLALAEAAGQISAIEAIENLRQKLIYENPLDRKTQQLIHFAMLIGAGEENPAKLHVKAALSAGATVAELFGVCETAAIVGGMPAFTRAVDIVFEAVESTRNGEE